MSREEADPDKTASSVIAVSDERGDLVGIEGVASGAPRTLKPESSRRGAFILGPNPEAAFLSPEIRLQRRQRPRRNRADGLASRECRRDIGDYGKPRRSERRAGSRNARRRLRSRRTWQNRGGSGGQNHT